MLFGWGKGGKDVLTVRTDHRLKKKKKGGKIHSEEQHFTVIYSLLEKGIISENDLYTFIFSWRSLLRKRRSSSFQSFVLFMKR